MRILTFEAGLGNKSLLTSYLQERMAIVDVMSGPDDLINNLGAFECDAVIVHLSEEGISEVDLIHRIRAVSQVPIIAVSRSLSEASRLQVLQAGADDLIVPPFSTEEVFIKVQNLVRRSHGVPHSALRIGKVILDLNGKRIYVDGQAVKITRKEYQIIEILALRNGSISKEAILDHLYPSHEGKSTKIVDVFICKIRRKLKSVGIADFIETQWGMGYHLQSAFPAVPVRDGAFTGQGGSPKTSAFA
jgi:two-component system cell cycle response regulator CtrA